MGQLYEAPVVRIRENKVHQTSKVSTISIFLSQTTHMFDINNYVQMTMPYGKRWACRESIRADTLMHISRYMLNIQEDNHLVIFNMSHMIDNIQGLIDAINDIIIRFKKSFVIISSEHGYNPQVLNAIRNKNRVALVVPNNVANGDVANIRYFTTQLKKEGFVCEQKAKHMISGNPLFNHAPEVHYSDGTKNHVHHDIVETIDTTGMVCTSGIYINPDGDVCLCPSDLFGYDRSYIYDNINNPDYNVMPVVNMCRGHKCIGSVNKHVRTLMQFAEEQQK